MRDFVGMDDVNETAKFALLDFSFNLTLGKLDEAYRSVKAIDRHFSSAVCFNSFRLTVLVFFVVLASGKTWLRCA